MTKRTVVLAVVLVTSLPGCVDLNEDVVTGLTPGAYGSQAAFQALVNASYEPLRSFWAQEPGFTLTEFGTDIFYKGADGSYKFVKDYTTQLNPTLDYITNAWNNFYRAINTANTALDQAAIVQMDSSVRAKRVGELRFLRALYYFYLVQMFGPLHITVHQITDPTTEAHRSPVDSVYDGVIIPDLQYAEANLPSVQQDYGRATKGAVQHLLAKVYLTRLRVPDDSVADEAAKRQAGDFANAADYAQRVIKSGVYQLLPRFADVFDFHNERNAEVIWSVQYTGDPLTTGPGNTGHLYFLMEYDVLPGMLRDIANGRPFKRFRPTRFFLSLYDRTKDGRYDAQFKRVWYANNIGTIPRDSTGALKFQLVHGGIRLDHERRHRAPAVPGVHAEDVQQQDFPVSEQVRGSVPARRQRHARLAGLPALPAGRDVLDRGRGADARRPAGGGAPLHQRRAAACRHPGA